LHYTRNTETVTKGYSTTSLQMQQNSVKKNIAPFVTDNYNNVQICVIDWSALASPCPRLGQTLQFAFLHRPLASHERTYSCRQRWSNNGNEQQWWRVFYGQWWTQRAAHNVHFAKPPFANMMGSVATLHCSRVTLGPTTEPADSNLKSRYSTMGDSCSDSCLRVLAMGPWWELAAPACTGVTDDVKEQHDVSVSVVVMEADSNLTVLLFTWTERFALSHT